MYRLTILLLIASWLFVAHGVIETTSLPGTPIAPSGTVCIQVVCPDPGDGDPTVCPERCNGACTTITNACCPQSEIAICAGEPTPGVPSTPVASSPAPAPTSASSPAVSSPAASSSSIPSSPASSASPPPAETTDASENPEDSTNALGLPYYVLPLALILVTKLLLL